MISEKDAFRPVDFKDLIQGRKLEDNPEVAEELKANTEARDKALGENMDKFFQATAIPRKVRDDARTEIWLDYGNKYHSIMAKFSYLLCEVTDDT